MSTLTRWTKETKADEIRDLQKIFFDKKKIILIFGRETEKYSKSTLMYFYIRKIQKHLESTFASNRRD
jgi:hypothetical protein